MGTVSRQHGAIGALVGMGTMYAGLSLGQHSSMVTQQLPTLGRAKGFSSSKHFRGPWLSGGC